MSIEAMKLALDALGPTAPECCGCAVEWEIAITALRQAIEQAQQAEPVAYSYTSKITGAQGFSHHPLPRFTDVEHWDIVPLYTTPPVATNDTTQERVAETSQNVHKPDYKALWQQMCERCDLLDKQLTQRKPLTHEQIKVLQDANWKPAKDGGKDWNTFEFARAIEAAHNIKGE